MTIRLTDIYGSNPYLYVSCGGTSTCPKNLALEHEVKDSAPPGKLASGYSSEMFANSVEQVEDQHENPTVRTSNGNFGALYNRRLKLDTEIIFT